MNTLTLDDIPGYRAEGAPDPLYRETWSMSKGVFPYIRDTQAWKTFSFYFLSLPTVSSDSPEMSLSEGLSSG